MAKKCIGCAPGPTSSRSRKEVAEHENNNFNKGTEAGAKTQTTFPIFFSPTRISKIGKVLHVQSSQFYLSHLGETFLRGFAALSRSMMQLPPQRPNPTYHLASGADVVHLPDRWNKQLGLTE
eukprot:4427167-Amphidinium_carterae.1